MKITSTGDKLNILITCSYSPHHDWMTFASWYSLYQNMPDAEISVLCARDIQHSRMVFNWPSKCGIRFFQHENVGRRFGCLPLNRLYAIYTALKQNLIREPFVVLDCDVMTLRSIGKNVLDQVNDPDVSFGMSGPVWYFKNQGPERLARTLNTFKEVCGQSCDDDHKIMHMMVSEMGEPQHITNLCSEPNDTEITVFSHYNNCGKFDKKKWIEHRSQSPFMYASQLGSNVNMTIDERQIIKLWEQMRTTYDMVC